MATRRRLLVVVLLVAAGVALFLLLRDGYEFSGDTRGARIERFDVQSRLVGETLEQTLVEPKGGSEGRPLLVFLHGRNGDPDSNLSDELFEALDSLGERAPAIVFANGGESSYYHDRDEGDWGSYVTDELVPAALRRSQADRRRVAIGGISMGGFGALDIARLNRGRFCAVGGHSAALWESAGETPEGAFDDAEDFAAHDVIGAARAEPAALGSQPIWLDVGRDDPFLGADEALFEALHAGGSDVALHEYDGEHEGSYWRDHMAGYLRFYARACGG